METNSPLGRQRREQGKKDILNAKKRLTLVLTWELFQLRKKILFEPLD